MIDWPLTLTKRQVVGEIRKMFMAGASTTRIALTFGLTFAEAQDHLSALKLKLKTSKE